ncbi:V-type proton ATPase 116 kDa subunit a2 [Manis javanica]|nr:V-type proton ATPase 116 kDa subunit a2 [Manis javanica]
MKLLCLPLPSWRPVVSLLCACQCVRSVLLFWRLNQKMCSFQRKFVGKKKRHEELEPILEPSTMPIHHQGE